MFEGNQTRSLQFAVILSLAFASCLGLSNFTSCGHKCGGGDCIQLDHLCDGTANCLDASDETAAMCKNVWCPGYSFRCNYGACIASTAVCDGVRDCVDGSDEEGWLCRAQMQQANCDNWEMYCSSGQCMPYSKLCNGIKDCRDGDDELESLCEGVPIPTTIVRSTTMTTGIDSFRITTAKTMKGQSQPHPIQRNGDCVIPQLSNVIVKHVSDVILTAGSRVANGTRIYYDCQAEHSLKGEKDNFCQDSLWVKKFPYCETPDAFIFSLVISIFSFLILVLIFLIWRVRRENGERRQREEHIWLVETSRSHPQQSDIPKV
ncbi:modular serine protease [Drosophila eugracilis]|uniref:modular serine protease n=1 Tax=Drosophila eugracilis TaxID=29029 RepID=UPI0007E6E8A5|nr:modular serine protease [Drosophila eugracilis]XP_017069435.1 modular serine protease [Drosophila eugracilis]